MFEGKELDTAIGKFGHVTADIDDKGNLEVGVTLRVNLIEEFIKIADKSPENKVLGMIRKGLERAGLTQPVVPVQA